MENLGTRLCGHTAKPPKSLESAAPSELLRALEDIRSVDPILATMYAEGMRGALRYFETTTQPRAMNH